MGRGIKIYKKSETLNCLTSQVRCADMPAARQTIHFFTFDQKRKIDKNRFKQNCEFLKVDSRNGNLRKTPNGKRLADRYLCHSIFFG